MTGFGCYPLITEEENCKHLVEVTEEEVEDSVHSVPKLDTLILVKAMIKNHSFSNPFINASTSSNPGLLAPPVSSKDRFQKDGRSNSAPEAYDCYDK